MTTTTDYQQQAIDFLNKVGATIETNFMRYGRHFDDDKENRDIYEVTITNKKGRKYTFNFGNSIADSGFYYTKGKQKFAIDRKYLDAKNILTVIKSKDWEFLNNGKSDIIHYPVKPTEYDILACITKYDPDTFENFCSEFGYDTDSRKAEDIYEAVKDEYLNICRLFNEDELNEMAEIQ